MTNYGNYAGINVSIIRYTLLIEIIVFRNIQTLLTVSYVWIVLTILYEFTAMIFPLITNNSFRLKIVCSFSNEPVSIKGSRYLNV